MARPEHEKYTENGRPQVKIDWEWVDKQLMAGCLGTEIAAALNCHPDTLYDRTIKEKGTCFSYYMHTKRSDGDRLLRGKQYETALKGNVTMQIWLGKQRLGQKEFSRNEELYCKSQEFHEVSGTSKSLVDESK